MKVGILTQPVGDNYGGILQNWALQQVLKSMGHHPVTIDAYRSYPYYRWLFSSARVAICRILGKHDISYPQKPIKDRLINRVSAPFIFNNIELTRPYKLLSSEVIERESLDAIVVGSDQVWRPKYNSHLCEMFLSFAINEKIKKIAYAASFGLDQWEMSQEQTDECEELLKQFDSVSLREASGVELCKRFLNRDASLVLDPTMLVERESYEKICGKPSLNERPYIAFYCLDSSIQKEEFAKRIAEKRNLEIKRLIRGNALLCSVSDWLNLIKEASIVVTDSFHGTVFSVLFKKPFITINNENRGRGRLTSLFDLLSIKGHLISETELDRLVDIDDDVDWARVMSNLDKMKTKSLEFLSTSLSL